MDKSQEIDFTDTQARLAQIVADAAVGQSTIILRDGHPEAVVVSYADWLRISGAAWPVRVSREVPAMPYVRPVGYDPPLCEPEI